MTKKESYARKEAWSLALKEGRVVRYDEFTMTSYPTIEARDAALARNGFGEIVVYPEPLSVPYVEVDTETAYGSTQRIQRSIRVF